MRGWPVLLGILFAACGGGGERAVAPPEDAVASWHDGAVSLAELESAFATATAPACRRARRAGGIEALLACYRELAEGLALEALVLADVGDLDRALEAMGEDGEDYRLLRRRAFLEVYLRAVREETEIAEAEVVAAYEADPERFRRPGQLTLSNIFRRHENPARPEETAGFLRRIKQRFEAGETFSALAREASHSETRLRGGEVGLVSEDRLPPRLARIAFALADGEVSDPVQVGDGAVLLYAQGIVEGVELSLEQVRGQIRRELAAERVAQAVSRRVAGREPPAGSMVLDQEELIAALGGEDPEAVVLAIEGDRLTVGELRRLAELGPRAPAGGLDDEARGRLAEVYSRQLERRLLALELVESADRDLRAEAESRLRDEAVSWLVDQRLRQELGRHVDADTLREYFEDNRHHYQGPLRFRMRLWSVPFGDDPPAQLRRMEALRERLAAGELDLAAAVAELGGRLENLGWRDFDSLDREIPNKARTYLLEVGDRGWSVPYQQDDALHLIRLDERQEPRPLEYDEAIEQVRLDYLARFQRQLYRRLVEERLAAAGFAFDEDAVRGLLAPEGAAAGADARSLQTSNRTESETSGRGAPGS